MTGSASDPLDWQPHIRNKPRREALAKRFRDPADPFKIVIVRDMWLTGFDAPCLHTMYVDKPMRGHGLMQAIARVNRVFRDKPGGLVVDYLGLADELQAGAGDLHRERRHGQDGHRPGRGRGRDAGEVRGLPAACSTASTGRRGPRGTPQERLGAAAGGAGAHPRPGGRQGAAAAARSPSCRRPSRWRCRTRRRCASATTSASSRPCAPCWPRARPASARPTRSSTTPSGRSSRKAVVSDEVVDIFAAAGLKKPDISILSDEFLAEVRGMPQRTWPSSCCGSCSRARSRPARAAQRRAGALLRRDAGAGHPRATRTGPSRRRRSSRS